MPRPDAMAAEPPSLPAIDEVGEAFGRYQACRGEYVPQPRPLALGDDRRRALAARLHDVGGLPGWDEVLARIRGFPFVRGETARSGFVAEIDWLLKPANLRKVMEGNFDERASAARRPSTGNGGRSPIDALNFAITHSGLV